MDHRNGVNSVAHLILVSIFEENRADTKSEEPHHHSGLNQKR